MSGGPRPLPDDDLCSSPIGPSIALAAMIAAASIAAAFAAGYVLAAHLYDQFFPTKE